MTASISINVEFHIDGQQAAFSRPIIPITGLLTAYWRAKIVLKRCCRAVSTTAAVARIGASAVKFALGG